MAAINFDEFEKAPEAPETELFTLNGVTYSIASRPRVNIALKYLKLARTEGADAAAGWMLEQVLGEDAYDALMNYDDLTQDILSQVTEAAQKIVLGGLEGPKGQ